jgi:DNA polymerase I-like protein with 3'-5' exonuclease and polymerase domains
MLGYSKLGDTINVGKDAHAMVAASILGVSYEDVIARKKEPEVFNARQTGKVVNFGCPGGLGPDKLVLFAKAGYGVTLTREQAMSLKSIWLETYPEFREYFRMADRLPDPLSHLFSDRLRGGCHYTAACNTLFQGLGSDITKLAGFAISKACYAEPSSALYGSHIVNFEHDAYILEVPEDKAHEAAMCFADIMIEAPKCFCPDVRLTTEVALAKRWSKNVEPIFENGRLIPWDK